MRLPGPATHTSQSARVGGNKEPVNRIPNKRFVPKEAQKGGDVGGAAYGMAKVNVAQRTANSSKKPRQRAALSVPTNNLFVCAMFPGVSVSSSGQVNFEKCPERPSI